MAINLLEVVKKRVKDLAGFIPPVQAYRAMAQPIRNFATDLPANIAYTKSKIHQKIAPNMPLPTAEKMDMWSKRESDIRPQFDLFTPPQKSASAEMRPYLVSPKTQRAEFLEEQKQKVLGTGEFRPAMKRYLERVPVHSYYPREGSAAGYATKGEPQPIIGMGMIEDFNFEKMKDNPYLAKVMKHELIHTAPRNIAFVKEFDTFFKSVKPNTHPMLYQVGLKYLDNGNPPPNEEEFYATVAENMGPEVLNIPEIRKFYENIFK